MKKLLLTLSLIGLKAGAYAQGQITLSNGSNTSNDPNATTGGLFWICSTFGSHPSLTTGDFNVNFYGGSDANSLVLLKSIVASGGGSALGAGTFLDLSGQPVSVPGALTTGFFRIEAWLRGSTFGTALARGQSSLFSNPLGNPMASPPGLPTDLTGMPAIIISETFCVSEPSTFALAGMGAFAFLILCRRAD